MLTQTYMWTPDIAEVRALQGTVTENKTDIREVLFEDLDAMDFEVPVTGISFTHSPPIGVNLATGICQGSEDREMKTGKEDCGWEGLAAMWNTKTVGTVTGAGRRLLAVDDSTLKVGATYSMIAQYKIEYLDERTGD